MLNVKSIFNTKAKIIAASFVGVTTLVGVPVAATNQDSIKGMWEQLSGQVQTHETKIGNLEEKVAGVQEEIEKVKSEKENTKSETPSETVDNPTPVVQAPAVSNPTPTPTVTQPAPAPEPAPVVTEPVEETPTPEPESTRIVIEQGASYEVTINLRFDGKYMQMGSTAISHFAVIADRVENGQWVFVGDPKIPTFYTSKISNTTDVGGYGKCIIEGEITESEITIIKKF